MEKQILTYLAGPQAQSLVEQSIDPTAESVRFTFDDAFMATVQRMHSERPMTCCTSDDCRALHRLLYRRDHETPASLKLDFIRAGSTALKILQHETVWRAIGSVAEVLLARGTMRDSDIRDAMPDDLHGVPMMTFARGMVSPLTPVAIWPVPVYPPISHA